MKTKIGVLGSCISRDAFNSRFVHNYKDFFEVKFSAQRTSLISLMQDSLLIDEKLIEIYPLTRKSKIDSQFIKEDLKKNFLNYLINDKIDYLVLDNYFDVIMGILYFDNCIITNNDWDLPRTELYRNMDDKLIFKITDFSDEYFCIWSKYCDLFFKFLELNCPDVKVILNSGRQTDKILKQDNTVYIESSFTSEAKIINYYLDKLDSYIYNNFDVEVIEFDYENTYLDENHLWGLAPMHYHRNFHYSFIEKIRNIVYNDNLNGKSVKRSHINDKSFFRKELNRTNFETKLLLKNINILNKLKFYNRGRIDLKNYGLQQNELEIIECDFKSVICTFPSWFKSNDGEGMVVESEKGSIDLKLRCVNDGFLKIYLRGPDIRDKNFNSFPVYIDYTNFIVNNELIFNNSKLVWHDEPYIFQKEVKDSEIINIHLEWLPFNKRSIYNKS